VCCSALQSIAVRYSRIKCVAVRSVAAYPRQIQVCCSVLQCFAVCCNMLQCVADRCSTLQCVAVRCHISETRIRVRLRGKCVAVSLQCSCSVVAVSCSVVAAPRIAASVPASHSGILLTPVLVTLQHTATHCNALKHNSTSHFNSGSFSTQSAFVTLQHTAMYCIALQLAAIHCKTRFFLKQPGFVTLQHTATPAFFPAQRLRVSHCNILQHTATCGPFRLKAFFCRQPLINLKMQTSLAVSVCRGCALSRCASVKCRSVCRNLMHGNMCVYMCVQMYIHTCMHKYMYVHCHIYIYIYTHTHTSVYMNTYTHTRKL